MKVLPPKAGKKYYTTYSKSHQVNESITPTALE
jgi:hypothetical protein